ncbi:hypothetical protein BDZ45DRAFT_213770 [Acephala macrosclerotiorum]|nr:hypothetical protein BDZ45DRAFT_213770 [Acephala macrosclerotiorum]
MTLVNMPKPTSLWDMIKKTPKPSKPSWMVTKQKPTPAPAPAPPSTTRSRKEFPLRAFALVKNHIEDEKAEAKLLVQKQNQKPRGTFSSS